MEISGRRPVKSDGRRTCLMCDPCKGENEEEPAVAYCTECNEYLCHMCRKAHTRTKVSKGHPLLDGDSMPKRKMTSDKGSMCPKHSNNPIEYYCKNHDQFSCSVCVTIDHKQCRFQYIDDIATDFHKSNEYVALKKASADLIRLLHETKGTATRNTNNIAAVHANFISDLHIFRSESSKISDSLENAAMKEAQIARDSDQKTINSIATACDSMLSDIQIITSELEELNKYKQKRQLVICSKRLLKTVNTYNERVNELSNQNRIREYKFQPNEELRRFLHSIVNLGDVKDKKNDGTTQQGTSTNKGAESDTLALNQSAATYVGNIVVQHSKDEFNCWISGGVIIDKTKLALVDRGNDSVKIADLDTKTLTSCIKLPIEPWDITCVNQDQLVVTCNDRTNGKLVFLKVGKSLSVEKVLDIDRHCRGIVYTNDTFFVTFIKPESSIKSIDMSGNVLKMFKTNKDDGALFSYPEYICLSTDQQTVFVSDWSNHTVTSLALDDTIQHVYTKYSMKCPRALAVDRKDNVYIAGNYSHNIHQLSTESNRSQVILDEADGVKSPWMVTYCKARYRLYISVEKGRGFVVYVYQLH